MYYCKDCHDIFDQPGESQDTDWQEQEHLTVPCCPHCGSERFTPMPEDDPREDR